MGEQPIWLSRVTTIYLCGWQSSSLRGSEEDYSLIWSMLAAAFVSIKLYKHIVPFITWIVAVCL
jgi:hypothetical protein